MNLETKITIYKFTPQVFTLTRRSDRQGIQGVFEDELRESEYQHAGESLRGGKDGGSILFSS